VATHEPNLKNYCGLGVASKDFRSPSGRQIFPELYKLVYATRGRATAEMLPSPRESFQ